MKLIKSTDNKGVDTLGLGEIEIEYYNNKSTVALRAR